ncbi:hypothetical protein [Pantoea stewartii]|uniref:hypothetical protein n=1 Tax=Pantoea stewartii TaxID=66269 RepID=UPI00197EA2BD|nr:hypothetical protein [Pantoea stewartii]
MKKTMLVLLAMVTLVGCDGVDKGNQPAPNTQSQSQDSAKKNADNNYPEIDTSVPERAKK